MTPPKASPLQAGYCLDRYELLCPIAEGGMASVWVARIVGKHGFEKLVAIKTILPQFAADPRFQKMFLDEARIASGIEHANIAQILDLGEFNEVLYLVMEFVDGDALSKIQRVVEKKGEKIPTGVLLRIGADICAGLHAAHELHDKEGTLLGVVHRDVSPQNVLISARGVAKVIDFGIAKARDRLAGETSTGQLKGKVLYMAPEQAMGVDLDRRADVYAVGAILYHLLCGKPVFEGPNQLSTVYLLASARAADPLPEEVPAPIRDAVHRAIEKDPTKRFATAADLGAALERPMVETGTSTAPPDVARFVAATVGDRAAKRKEALALAMKAAGDRVRLRDLVKVNDPDSSNAFVDLENRLRLAPLSPSTLGDAMTPSELEPLPTVPGIPSAVTVTSESGMPVRGAAVGQNANPVPADRKRTTVLLALAALALCALGVWALVRGGTQTSDARTQGVGPSATSAPASTSPQTIAAAGSVAPFASSASTGASTTGASTGAGLVPSAAVTDAKGLSPLASGKPAPSGSKKPKTHFDDGF